MRRALAWTVMLVLVRFGEIALKSRYVRRQLRDRLVANIQDLFAAERVECVTEADEARIYVHVDEDERARRILTRAFGVVSVSPAVEAPAERDVLRGRVLEEATRAGVGPGRTFAIRPRRVGEHPFTSQDLAKDFGAAVLAAHPDARVDLTHPEIEIHVEVRLNRGFVFHEVVKGPGGLPLGSQGRALALVEDDAGLAAAWMGMKRGCRMVVACHQDAGIEVPLRRWDPRLKVLPLQAGPIEELVRLARASALFVGTRGADFDPARRPKVPVPVFEPVIGLSDAETADLVARIRAA